MDCIKLAAGPALKQSACAMCEWISQSVSRANCYLDDMRGWSFCLSHHVLSLASSIYVAKQFTGFMTLFCRHDFGPDFRSRRHCLRATANKTNTDVAARIDLTAARCDIILEFCTARSNVPERKHQFGVVVRAGRVAIMCATLWYYYWVCCLIDGVMEL